MIFEVALQQKKFNLHHFEFSKAIVNLTLKQNFKKLHILRIHFFFKDKMYSEVHIQL